MNIPLKNLLKKQKQVELAFLQDEAIDIVFSLDKNAVFHGGTCIWRCYDGKRFSEDLDFYSSKKLMEKDFLKETKRRGLTLIKFRKTENSIYSKISSDRVECSIEFALRKKKGILLDYFRTDGGIISVFGLSKEDLIIEKALAFSNRKLVRDVYDVYFLTANCDMKKITSDLKTILNKWDSPVDEKNLKSLVYSGPIPNYNQMLQTIKRRLL
jgi:predicted nucleotidyltransferase component of viral defense system